jgi:hypothetical protein
MNTSMSIVGLMSRIVEPPPPEDIIPVSTFDLNAFSVRVDAFRENLPMPLGGLDISDLPEKSRIMLDAIFEEDAEQTVQDAKMILDQEMASYTSPWIVRPTTGFLRDSIHWQKQVDGTRIVAGAPYAWWVEEGQRTFPGYHYMKTAVEWAKLRLPIKIMEEINGLIFSETI